MKKNLDLLHKDKTLPNKDFTFMPDPCFLFGEGFESTIYVAPSSGFKKIFKDKISNNVLEKKEKILKIIFLSEISEKYNFTPKIQGFIYNKDYKFTGYTMTAVDGTILNDFCKNISTEEKIFIFRNIQENIKTLHRHNLCMTDYNPNNFLIKQNYSVNFVDVDSYLNNNDSTKEIYSYLKYNYININTIGIKQNIYSFYSLFLDILFNLNTYQNKKSEIIFKITEEKYIPDWMKEKLIFFVKIRNKTMLNKIEWLF